MSERVMRFELQCSPEVAASLKKATDLEFEIYEERPVQRDFGAFLLGVIAGVAGNYVTRLIDAIAKEVDRTLVDEEDENDDATKDGDEGQSGRRKAYFIFNGETYDLTIAVDREDLAAALDEVAKPE